MNVLFCVAGGGLSMRPGCFRVSLPLRRDVTKDQLGRMPPISKFAEVFHLNYGGAVLHGAVCDVIVPFPFCFVFLPAFGFVCVVIADGGT